MKRTKPDVTENSGVRVTDWGNAFRIDLNGLGARIPPAVQAERERAAWAAGQNEALCEAMSDSARQFGGDLRSVAEWTVTYGALYDGDQMRTERRNRFGEGYRSAITTLGWMDPGSEWATRIQTTAYVSKDASAPLKQTLWQPEALYETEFMGLAPAVLTELDDCRLLHISGLVAWDKTIAPLFTEDPAAQIRYVYRMMEAVFREAGGSANDICRLRMFCPSAGIAAMLREEASRLWQGKAAPTLLIADNLSFGNPPKLYTEIQVMGIIGDGEKPVEQASLPLPDAVADRETLTIKATRTASGEVLHIGEIRPFAPAEPERQASDVCEQLQRIADMHGILPEQICNAVVYAGSAEAAAAFAHVSASRLAPSAVHLVPCRRLNETGDRQLKLELTARRSGSR